MKMIYFGIFIFFFGLSISFAAFAAKDENLKKVEQGMMSKVTYEDHTYIVWSINMGGGMVHDPECKCLKGTK